MLQLRLRLELLLVNAFCLAIYLVEALNLKTNFHSPTTALSTLVRSKRQIWYLCGQYPRQYYSNYPCYSSGSSTCENGGRKLNVACSAPSQCAPYYRGAVTCLRGCCCTAPEPQILPNTIPGQGYCPNGQLTNVRCGAPGQCPRGQTCLSGLCCTTTTNEYTVACGGQFAISACGINRSCQSGMVCTSSNYCCQCPVGRSGGQCNRGLCNRGYTCHPNGYCCPSCPNNVMPYGICRNGQCGGGRRCSVGNICC
ncbi:hypothetical protein M3Y97_00333300 [Aphelenchoides bicaudatus]|nr:hypothetical protein M3Y97_00333300 [Aphelenchoides bicaudatus]